MAKSWNDKLNDSKDLPKLVEPGAKMVKRFGAGKMVIPAPLDVDARMKKVRKGRLTTIDLIRESIASEHNAAAT